MELKRVGNTHSVLLLLGSFNFIIQIVLRIIRALCTMQFNRVVRCWITLCILHEQFQYLPHFHVIADNTCARARISSLLQAQSLLFGEIILDERNGVLLQNYILFFVFNDTYLVWWYRNRYTLRTNCLGIFFWIIYEQFRIQLTDQSSVWFIFKLYNNT